MNQTKSDWVSHGYYLPAIQTALLALLMFIWLSSYGLGIAQDAATSRESAIAETPQPPARNVDQRQTKPPRGLTSYMGRKIALPMSYHGIPWLNRPERLDEEQPDLMLDELRLTDGMVVCDMGAGDGYHTFRMAKKVAPSGKVVSVDIQPEMLQALSRRMEEVQIRNIDVILGELWDPKLEPESIDVLLMVDVYHEFSHPVHMLSKIRDSLKPDGVVALVEFRAEDPTVLIKPDHKMTKRQAIREFEANGFKLVREFDRLPQQHLMFFGKD